MTYGKTRGKEKLIASFFVNKDFLTIFRKVVNFCSQVKVQTVLLVFFSLYIVKCMHKVTVNIGQENTYFSIQCETVHTIFLLYKNVLCPPTVFVCHREKILIFTTKVITSI